MQITIHHFLVLALLIISGGGLTMNSQTNSTTHEVSLPLSFEQNVGQFNSPVRFAARGPAYGLALHQGKAILNLQKVEKNGSRVNDTVVTQLAGARKTAVAAEDPLPGKINYLIGDNPQDWKTNVPTYGRIRYRGIYPGIDLVYYGNQQQLEYDFVIAPGSNPENIALKLSGAKHVSIDQSGALHLTLAHGEVVWHAPQSYQTENGNHIPVASKFVLANGQVHFHVGDYDRKRELVIDPVLAYSTYLGPGVEDPFLQIAVDGQGNTYIAGTTGPGWMATPGAFQSNYNGGTNDAFITKINASGTALVYSTYIGGNDQDSASSIAVDSTGNAYLVGETVSTNFPLTVGAFKAAHSQSFWSFLLKLNASGSSIDYSAWLPSITANSVAVDSSGNAYFTGASFPTNGDPVPTTAGAFRTSHGDLSTCSNVSGASYAWEMNSAGSAPLYVTYLSDCEVGRGIAVDAAGNAYVTGLTESRHYVTPGAFQLTFGGYIDGFVTKLNNSGNAVIYSSYYGGTIDDEAYGIAVDPAGEAMITGRTNSMDLPVVNAYQATSGGANSGSMQAYVAKFNATGTGLVYGTYLGGSGQDLSNSIATDANGRAFVTGEASSFDFPTKNAFQGICGTQGGAQQKSCIFTAFATAFNADGTLLYSTWVGSKSSFGDGTSITADAAGNAYLTGITGVGFPVTTGAYQTQFQGNANNQDAFTVKISPQQTQGCTLNRTKPSTTICEPQAGDTTTSPLHISALANDSTPVVAMQVYVDGLLWFSDDGPFAMDAYIAVPPGSHGITVKGWNTSGANYLSTVGATVAGTGSAAPCDFPTNTPSIRICNPLSGSTVPASGVHLTAKANSSQNPVTAMRLYIDDQSVATVSTNTLDTTVPLSPGQHSVVVQGWDWRGQVFKEKIYVTAR